MAISREQTILLKFIDGKLENKKDEFGNNTWDYPKDLPDLLAVLFKRVVRSSYKIISDDQDGTYSTVDTDGLILLLTCFGNLVMTFDEKTRIRLSNLGFIEDIISMKKNIYKKNIIILIYNFKKKKKSRSNRITLLLY